MFVINYKNKVVLLLLSILAFPSCNKENSVSKIDQRYAIYSIVTAEISNFKPPPPPIDISGEDLVKFRNQAKKYHDSIRKTDVVIGVSQGTFIFSEQRNAPDFPDSKILIKKLNEVKIKSKIDLSRIKSQNNRKLIPITKTGVEVYENKKFDWLITFSEVVFNDKMDKALVASGIGIGRLSGYSNLIFLTKNNGKWQIEHTELLGIS